MKMLMFHVREFWFRTHERNLETAEEREQEGALEGGGILAWIHVESGDLEDVDSVTRKAAKNLKWLARKVGAERIALHSFAHLSADRADPTAAQDLLERIRARLEGVGYEVLQTPWGYFNEFRMHVEGPSLAKVWKEL